jgi:hypothetical protein
MNIEKFAPLGTKDCESKCDRKVHVDGKSRKIICVACQRIVMEMK